MRLLCLAACTCLLSIVIVAQPPTITFQSQNLSGLTSAVDLVSANDGSDRMFIVQQNGIIRVWNRATGLVPGAFLDIGPDGLDLLAGGGEQGLLSMAFHPSYNGTTNRYFFVYYTNSGSNIEVARFQTSAGNPNLADGSTFASVIIIDHPGQTNHNGGKLNFGTDGYLYFATGDGGGSNDPGENAQDGKSLLGKMIRIDIDRTDPTYGNYAVPADNPFVGNADFDERVYALGLRNPFRWTFDRANGDMWIGDVGQSAREEVNYRPAGSTAGINYGWRCYEGSIPNPSPSVPACAPAGQILPVYEYNNPSQGRAITGGYVYRGSEYPAYRGYYIAVDYILPNIFIVWPNGTGGWNSDIQTGITGIPAFGEAEDGTLYAVTSTSVLKVVATGGTVLPVRLIDFNVRKYDGQNELKWATGQEQNTARFHIEYSVDGRMFSRAGVVPAARIESGSTYRYIHRINETRLLYYRLAVEDDDGSVEYSSIIQVPGDESKSRIYPTVIRNSNISVVAAEPALSLQMVSSAGATIFTKRLDHFVGTMGVVLPALPKGFYIARLTTESGTVQVKVMID